MRARVGSIIMAMTIIIWNVVLNLPHQLAAMTTPFSAATSLKPLIMNSLAIMITTIHDGILPRSIRQIMALHTSSLSAKGSINLPKFVTRLYFLAIFPSSISVRDATIKIASATRRSTWSSGLKSNATTKNGIKITRKIVNLFGKFIIQFLLSNHSYLYR